MSSQPEATHTPSTAVLKAQARLLAMRQERGILPSSRPPQPNEIVQELGGVNWLLKGAQQELARRREQEGVRSNARPSAPVTTSPLMPTPSSPSTSSRPKKSIVAHPSMLLAMLKQHQEAAGRVYFLLRHLDTQGQGWVAIDAARERLTQAASSQRICGWRRLRQIFAQGEGVFWQRDHRRIWLFGQHRIARNLGCERLKGYPVALPIKPLLTGIQAVRAAFYAAFHAGRRANPISRETLRQVSGVAERTQRTYDYLAPITRQRNIAVGTRYSAERAQQRAWQHGRAVFSFVDVKGKQGQANTCYLAWHLPNSYQAAYARRSSGCRRRLNRQLADLLNQGITGNDGTVVERVFFPDSVRAARSGSLATDAYWTPQQGCRSGAGLWYTMKK